ncbi:MAG TPA: glycosyltransferase [Verrucomicrobiae bacterium]|jgi:1,2-diacylglycerol 3-alpha-glucosyltransferase|nr:glycosyltransferase [Verrucomicrobiae bacterium]
MRRLVILTEIISPYRIPLFNALAAYEGIDLHVIFLAETDPNLRQWEVQKDAIQFSYQVLSSRRTQFGDYNVLLNAGVSKSLRTANPDVILCGGYNYLASWQALLWARFNNVPFLLWSESNIQDMRPGHAPVEFLKDEFLRRCSGFIVPGRSARNYLCSRKIKDDVIFTAPNAVDNALFQTAAAQARKKAESSRLRLELPARYFLFAGRLVPEKGVFELLSAYAKLDASLRQQTGLVLVGDGPLRDALEALAAKISPGMVKFAGFIQQKELGTYYGLADALILPTYTDTWGLVVNEAMACGLPIILSRAAGCAADLVSENCNGLLVPPADASALASAMAMLAQHPDLSKSMGSKSSERVAEYSPAKWTEGVVLAVDSMGGARD